MKTVADVNVLFAITVEAHVHHEAAWTWWEGQGDGDVGLCWQTRLAVLRLLTNRKAMNEHPVSPEEALDAWDELAADPRTFWLDDTAPSHEKWFRQFITGRIPSPNLWADAWLAALAASEGFNLTSFDSDFRSFGLSDFEHLAA